MKFSETMGAIATALAKAQAAIKGAPKDSTNPHFNSRYADLLSIREACRDALGAHELSVIQSPSADANLVRMTTLLLHSSGEWIESDVLQVQARDANPQAVGSCLTYLRRYQLAAMLGIAPEDDDAEAAEGRTAVTRATPAKHKQEDVRADVRADVQEEARALDEAELPAGAVYVDRIDPTPTKNPSVTRYLVKFSNGKSASTIKDKLATDARNALNRGLPVIPTIEKKGDFENLVGLTEALSAF